MKEEYGREKGCASSVCSSSGKAQPLIASFGMKLRLNAFDAALYDP